MDYINTSHPNFIGGSKAVEVAQQQVKSSRPAVSVSKPKVHIPVLTLKFGIYMKVFCFTTSFKVYELC